MTEEAQQRLLPQVPRSPAPPVGPVECLGKTFASDDERRDHYLARLRELLPELRRRPDFPKGSDEDILRLSDPPWYTACPNPFLEEFMRFHGRPYDPEERYHREPFAVDVSVREDGRALPRARVPHQSAASRHRPVHPPTTPKPGDLVLDGFCGSGMTGVAAQWCGTAPAEYRRKLEADWQAAGRQTPEWGTRRAVLGDLSPAATFIAANYNIPFDVEEFAAAARKLLDEVEEEVGWMYETRHTDGTQARINYTVWSEVLNCRQCGAEVVFLNEALDSETKTVHKTIVCPECRAQATKEQMDLQFEVFVDDVTGQSERRPKRVPALVNYNIGKLRLEKVPDGRDLDVIRRIGDLATPSMLPVTDLPDCQMTRVGRMRTTNTVAVRHMFLPRAAHALSAVWRRATSTADPQLRHSLLFFVEQSDMGYVCSQQVQSHALLTRKPVLARSPVRRLPSR